MAEIHNNPMVYRGFLNLSDDFRERFTLFCMGVRGVQMTYDPFFNRIFDAEVHPERLSEFLSQVFGRRLTVKRMLPNEHRRISDKVEHVYKVLVSYPWFREIYEEIKEFRNHPEEAIGMFSDALRILDENTVRYIIDEFKQKINLIAELQRKLAVTKQ